MWRWWVILALAAMVAVSMPSQPNQTPNPKKQTPKQIDPSRESSNPHYAEEGPQTHQSKSNGESPPGNTSIKGSQWPSSEWWLVIVGFGTLAVVCWQTTILSKSVAVATKSAETTRKQVDLYVNAERARIIIDIKDMGRSFEIVAKNTGKTTAIVTYARGRSLILPFGELLPATPPYLTEDLSGWDYSELIEPGIPIDLMNDDTPNGDYGLLADLSDIGRCEQIRDKKINLWVFGRIVYGDGISSIERETRFCYRAEVSSSLETNIAMAGPPAYRKAT